MTTNTAECDAAIETCAVKAVKDISHRECNVTVIGLPKPENGDDVAAFSFFCESHRPMSVKPAVESVKRLHRKEEESAVSQKPPLLLVKLHSAQAANDLRYASRSLRNSLDPV